MKIKAVIVDELPKCCSVCGQSVKFMNEWGTEVCKITMKGYKPEEVNGRLLSCPLMTDKDYIENKGA